MQLLGSFSMSSMGEHQPLALSNKPAEIPGLPAPDTDPARKTGTDLVLWQPEGGTGVAGGMQGAPAATENGHVVVAGGALQPAEEQERPVHDDDHQTTGGETPSAAGLVVIGGGGEQTSDDADGAQVDGNVADAENAAADGDGLVDGDKIADKTPAADTEDTAPEAVTDTDGAEQNGAAKALAVPLVVVASTTSGHDEKQSDRSEGARNAADETPQGPGEPEPIAAAVVESTAPAETIASEKRPNRLRRKVLGVALGVLAIGTAVTAAILLWKGHFDPNATVNALPSTPTPPTTPPPVPELVNPNQGLLLPGASADVVGFSEAARTTSNGEGWLHVIGEVVPGITSAQAHTLLGEVSPTLLQIQSNTGEAIAYTGAPGGIGINKGDGIMSIAALQAIHEKAVQLGLKPVK